MAIPLISDNASKEEIIRFCQEISRILERHAYYVDRFGSEEGYEEFANLTADRTLDADATSTAELADVLGTLVESLKNIGIISK